MNQSLQSGPVRIPHEFQRAFEAQKAFYRAHRNPSCQERVADLKTLLRMLVENRDALVEAVSADYGTRARFETLLSELLINQEGLLDAIKQLPRWMRPQSRPLDRLQHPFARARVIPQPLGVVGIIAPWNFPINLVFSPLTGIFAAGNTAMVKMSENSEALADLLIELSPRYFPQEKLSFFRDEGGRGPAFSSLPFDHLLFTGSSATGRAVMANCAANLTPVTLELGGKSPAVVAPDFSLRKAAERIFWVKLFNAGQICINVDYLFLPENAVDSFVREAKRTCARRYPDINSGDYTAIIDQRAYDRLVAASRDAQEKGARVIDLLEGQRPDPGHRILMPQLLLDVDDSMEVMQREIFGPLLPVKTYRDPQEVIDYIESRDRPLAFYVFTEDRELAERYIGNTMSGGVTVNDGLLHSAVHSLPFGGVGNSGMGHYHGYEGFTTFSKLRPVFYQSRFRTLGLFMPPYRGLSRNLLALMLKMKS